MRRFDEPPPFVPSKEEAAILINSKPDLKQQTMTALLYSSGLRIGEVYHRPKNWLFPQQRHPDRPIDTF